MNVVVKLMQYRGDMERKSWTQSEASVVQAAQRALEAREGPLWIEHDDNVEDGSKTFAFVRQADGESVMSVALCGPQFVVWSPEGHRMAAESSLIVALSSAIYPGVRNSVAALLAVRQYMMVNEPEKPKEAFEALYGNGAITKGA